MDAFDGDDDDDRPYEEEGGGIKNNNHQHPAVTTTKRSNLPPEHTNTNTTGAPHPHFGEIDEAAAHAELRAAITKDGLRLEISSGRLAALYDIGKPIGKGKFSTVYKAIRKTDECPVALKRIALFDIMDAKSREKCLKEIRLVQSLDHPNIIRYLDGFFEDKQLILIFEYAEAGDLKRQLRKAKEREARFDERVIWKYFAQVAHAVLHMHERRILHRDLKPANIFLTLSGSIKVGDLGLGRLLSEQTMEAHSKVGTPLYMSPEVLRGKGYEWSSDVWSLGCILYELAMLRNPFKEEGLNLYDLFQKITTGIYPPISSVYSQDLRDLVDSMLRQDPGERIEMVKVVAKADEMRILTEKARQQQQQVQSQQNTNTNETLNNDNNSTHNTTTVLPVPSSSSSSLPPPIDTKSVSQPYNANNPKFTGSKFPTPNNDNDGQTVLPTPVPELMMNTNKYLSSETKHEDDINIEQQRKPMVMNRINFSTTAPPSSSTLPSFESISVPSKPNLSPIDIHAVTTTGGGNIFPTPLSTQPTVSTIGRIQENSKLLPMVNSSYMRSNNTGMQRLEMMDQNNISSLVPTVPSTVSPLEMVAPNLYQPPPVNETLDLIELAPTEASSSLYDRLQLIFQQTSTFVTQGKLSTDYLWNLDHAILQHNIFHRYCFALPTAISLSNSTTNTGYLQFRLFISLVRYLGLQCTRLIPGDRYKVADYTARMEDLWTDHKTGTVPPLMIAQNILQILHTYIPGANNFNLQTLAPSTLVSGYGTNTMKILMCLADNALIAMEFRTFMQPCAFLHASDKGTENDYEIIEEGVEEENHNNYNEDANQEDTHNNDSIDDEEILIKSNDRPNLSSNFTSSSKPTSSDLHREALLVEHRSLLPVSERKENDEERIREPWLEPFASPEKLQAWLREYENLKTRLNVLDKQLAERVANGSLFIGSIAEKNMTTNGSIVSNWRGHVQVMHNYVDLLHEGLPNTAKGTADTSTPPPLTLSRTLEILVSLAEDINESLVRINDTERRWNSMNNDNGNGRTVVSSTSSSISSSIITNGIESIPLLTAQYASLHSKRQLLENEVRNNHQTILNHQQIYENLQNDTEAILDALEEKTNELSSSTRVQAVRAALVNLQKENANMLIQLGILQNTLIHKEYAHDTDKKEAVTKRNTVDDDYDEEDA